MTAAETALAQAQHLLEVNRADDAARVLKAHLTNYPQDVSALSLLASANLQLNRPADAVRASDEALSVDPDYPAALRYRTRALRQLGQHTKAVASAERLVRLAPNLWTSHYTLALVLRDLPARRGAALGPATRAVELAPNNADPYVLLGAVYSDAHDFGLAAQYYRRALAIDPENAFATSNLSTLALRRGHFGKAMRGFRTAAAASPQEEVFHRNIVTTVFAALVKYGVLIAVLNVVGVLIATIATKVLPYGGWLPRMGVLLVIIGAWTRLLTTKLRPLSPYLRGQLRTTVIESLRTWRFRLLVAAVGINQILAFTILLDPALRPTLRGLLAGVAYGALLAATVLYVVKRRPTR